MIASASHSPEGLNLENAAKLHTDDQIVYAARDGRIQPAQLDRMAQGMIDLVNKTRAAMSIETYRFSTSKLTTKSHIGDIESMVLCSRTMMPSFRSPAVMPRSRSSATQCTSALPGSGSSHITPAR